MVGWEPRILLKLDENMHEVIWQQKTEYECNNFFDQRIQHLCLDD